MRQWSKTVRIPTFFLLFCIFLFPFSNAVSSLSAQTAEEIIERMEDNQISDSSFSRGRMITTDKYGTITRTFVSWSKGSEDALIEFTSKGEEGQKILRTEDEIYLYFPDAEDILRIQGSAMRDSVMDSDFSYEDMTGDKGLLADYTAELLRKEEVNGLNCFVVHLTAKSRSVPYYAQNIWVDSRRFVGVKAEKFSRSATLLKEMEVLEWKDEAGMLVPVHMVMRDAMKKNSSTEFILDDLQLNIPLDSNIFSLDELSW